MLSGRCSFSILPSSWLCGDFTVLYHTEGIECDEEGVVDEDHEEHEENEDIEIEDEENEEDEEEEEEEDDEDEVCITYHILGLVGWYKPQCLSIAML